jgi:hypothetical protein
LFEKKPGDLHPIKNATTCALHAFAFPAYGRKFKPPAWWVVGESKFNYWISSFLTLRF